jgi:hypothetical protein
MESRNGSHSPYEMEEALDHGRFVAGSGRRPIDERNAKLLLPFVIRLLTRRPQCLPVLLVMHPYWQWFCMMLCRGESTASEWVEIQQ